MSATHFKTIADLREAIVAPNGYGTDMLHQVPDLPIVKNRGLYLVEKAKGKVVLDIGCTGQISQLIKQSAKTYYGVDRVAMGGCEAVDLDERPDLLPRHEDVDAVIASEILEHLTNPGNFLLKLKEYYPTVSKYFTAPNAGGICFEGDCEVVNKEHVAWYSYTTLKTLLTRCGFEIVESRWHNGEQYKAEGIIMVAT